MLPRNSDSGAHTVDDGVLQAMGPGAARAKGFMDNTEVFRAMADALGLGEPVQSRRTKQKSK